MTCRQSTLGNKTLQGVWFGFYRFQGSNGPVNFCPFYLQRPKSLKKGNTNTILIYTFAAKIRGIFGIWCLIPTNYIVCLCGRKSPT